MLNNEILDDEIDGIIDHLKGTIPDITKYMNNLYSDTVFMGIATQCFSEDTIDSLKLSARICMKYFMGLEDYLKVSKLNVILSFIDKPKKVEVDAYILTSLHVSPN